MNMTDIIIMIETAKNLTAAPTQKDSEILRCYNIVHKRILFSTMHPTCDTPYRTTCTTVQHIQFNLLLMKSERAPPERNNTSAGRHVSSTLLSLHLPSYQVTRGKFARYFSFTEGYYISANLIAGQYNKSHDR